MKTKRFTGFIDGHFVSGRYVETDEADYARERQEEKEEKEKGSALGRVASAAGKLAVGAVAVGIIVGMLGGNDKGK